MAFHRVFWEWDIHILHCNWKSHFAEFVFAPPHTIFSVQLRFTQNTVLPHLPPIQIDNENVEIVDECLNLGIKMNKHLTWDDHVSLIKKKVYSTLRTLNCHRHTLSIDTKIKLVHTLLMPHFIYGNVIFSKMNVDTERHLQVCFNSCIRFVHNLRRFDHV